MTNPTPTFAAEQLEEARTARVERLAKYNADQTRKVVKDVDTAIAILHANRDHIGAFALVVVAKPGTATVHPESLEASEGNILKSAMNDTSGRVLHTHLRGMIEG